MEEAKRGFKRGRWPTALVRSGCWLGWGRVCKVARKETVRKKEGVQL